MSEIKSKYKSGTPSITAEFTAHFLNCLADHSVAERMQLIFEPMFKARLNPIAGKMAHSKRILTQTVDALRRSVTARSLWYASWMGMSYTCRAMLMTSNSLAARTKSLAYQRTPWHNRSEGPMALQPKDEVATSIDTRWYCHISSCWQRQPVSCWWLPRGTSCHTCQFASRRPKNWVIAVRKMLNPEN